MPESKQELLRGTRYADPQGCRSGSSHYAIAQRLQQSSTEFFQVYQGFLRPALQGVEERGWFESAGKESQAGRQAKFYSWTKRGRRPRNAEVIHWQRLSDAVGFIWCAALEAS